MRKHLLHALAVSLIVCAASTLHAAPAKSPAKPAQATAQIPGDQGVFGTVYTLRKSDPIYFRLKSAEYTTEQLIIGESLYTPKAGEKMLVLHFTVQNPSKSEMNIRWDSLRFTAVDATNTNHEYINDWGDEKGRQSVDMMVKPTQTLDVYSAIIVPAKGGVPKLMVLTPMENDGPILRYDLKNEKNKVTPLKPPVADPADKSGYTALETVTGALNAFYPYENYDISVQKFEFSKDPVNGNPPDEGTRYMMVTLTFKNESHHEPVLRWDSVTPVLLSTDEEELYYADMLLATANRSVEKTMKYGAEITARLCFNVPEDATPKTLQLKENESRIYEFAIEQ